MRSRARAADYRQAREAAEMFIGDRSENPQTVVKEPDRQRLASDFKPRVAGSERPEAGCGLRHFAALGAAEDEAIIGASIGAGSEPEDPGAEAIDF